jgi:hypothetical protein
MPSFNQSVHQVARSRARRPIRLIRTLAISGAKQNESEHMFPSIEPMFPPAKSTEQRDVMFASHMTQESH